jgi:ABC-type uncharacterized transport system permease subunit
MPENIPNAGQITLIGLSAVLLVLSAITAMLRKKGPWLAIAAAALALTGIIWHAAARGSWMPLEDNFEALAWLGVLLTLCVLYVQATRPVGGLDIFLLPVAGLLLVGAAVFGRLSPHRYSETAWAIFHRLTAYGGALGLAIAGAVGAMYLVANRRLRNKNFGASGGPAQLGSLERLESVGNFAITLGWPLFTVGLVTGLLWGIHRTSQGRQHEFFGPKIILAVGVWILYALALHTPINPSFRGKKAAVLSLIGLVLMAGTLVAVQFMPGGQH